MDSLDSMSEDEGISELADSPSGTQEELEDSSQCINPSCKNPKPEMLFSANPYLLTHFRCGPNEKKKICEPCFDNFQQNIHLLKIPPKKTASPVKVYKEYNDELKKMMGELVEKHLEGFSTDSSDASSEVEDFLSDADTDVNVEISPPKEMLEAESKQWNSEELALQFKKEEEQMDLDIELLKNRFYNTNVTDDSSANKPKKEIKSKIQDIIKPSTSHSERKPPSIVKPIPDDQTSYTSSLKDSGPSSPAEPLTPSRPSSPDEPLPPLPPVGPIEKPVLNVGDSAYAMQKNNEQEFKMSKISEKKGNAYKIKFDGIRTKSKKASPTTTLTGKHLAYVEPCKYRLPVGTRCIAIYREEPDLTERFFGAIVAEAPKLKNWHRYLIFFDDGYAAYLPHEDLRLVVEPLTEVWKDGPCDPDFIKTFLDKVPNQSLVRLAIDDKIEAYHNMEEAWLEARVVEVDASLAKLDFGGDHLEQEWIYRGSSRLKPIHSLEQAKVDKATETLSGVVPAEDLWKEKKEVKGSCFEKKGRLVSEDVYMEPKKLEAHDCDWKCISGPGLGYKDGDDREDNLLMIPIKHGWVRRVLQYYEYEKRCVEYVAPCGRKLRNLEEVHAYLKLTDSQMEIDFFNVDWWVHVQNRFQPEKELISMKDMSFGKENVPVSLVNSVNIEYPEFLAYSKVRLPQNNVNIPLDEEFLVCCDCEDDCSDERKCSCRQLTKREAGDAVIAGYEFKRLQDSVLTGIYECNSRCKCKHNCHNRVAQKPLRGKLQMFKTANRGWGIRSLVDIPQGTFICIYVGHLYESDEADKLAMTDGDDYFAQLDLIEVAEEQKGGYGHDDDDEGFAEDGESSKSGNISQMDGATSESEMDIEPEKEKNSEEALAKSEESNMEVEPEREKNTESSTSTTSKDTSSNESRQKTCLKSVRKCFARLEGRKEEAYVMDAKLIGNIGRYMNHSCNPNVFVQNAFVDTHDLRFPWVAFFAFTFIKAGDELCWNYNYEILVDAEQPLMCNCGTSVCKGRLL